jgi:hypothetical protein
VRREEEDEESKVLIHTCNSGEERDRQQLISPDHLPTSAMTHSPNSDTVCQKVSNETSKNRCPYFFINSCINRLKVFWLITKLKKRYLAISHRGNGQREKGYKISQ